MNWPAEHIDRLRTLHANGMSGSQIAVELNKEFGTAYTRNSIIGKCHRLGDRMATASATPRQRRRRTRLVWDAGAGQERAAEVGSERPRSDRACTLLDLTSESCRWPVGEPGAEDFYFCGEKVLGPLPYCGFHARMAYQPAAERRRARAA